MWILLIKEKEFVGKLMSFQYFLEKKLHFLLFFELTFTREKSNKTFVRNTNTLNCRL